MKYLKNCVLLIIPCLVVLTFVSPAFAASHSSDASYSDWTMLGYSASHHRVNPQEHLINVHNVSNIATDWTVQTGGVIQSLDTIVHNGIAYFTSQDGKLYAVTSATGTVLWSESLNPSDYQGGLVYSSPAIANGVLYVGVGKNTIPYSTLYALNAKTGTVLWSVDGPGPFSSPTIVHGVVYVGGSANTLYALNASTGAILWSNVLSTIPNYISDSPAIVNGVVYVAINGVNPITKVSTGLMYALNASTGVVIWSTPMGAQISNSSPAVAKGMVYIGDGDGLLYAFNTQTGSISWTSLNIGNVIASPAVHKGLVYIGGNGLSNHKLFALNAQTGAVVWTANTDSNIIASASVANGVVYDASTNGSFYAFNAATGATLWSDVTNSCPSGNNCTLSSPVISNGMLYVGMANTLYTFHLPTALI